MILLAAAVFAGCKRETPKEPDCAPAAEFSIPGDDIEIKLGEVVDFGATVDCTCDYTCAWFLDGVKISNVEMVSYAFNQKGDFEVSFIAENYLGKVERSYTVHVTGEALFVEFSEPSEHTININVEESLAITATVVSGDKQTVHSWKVGETEVSTTTQFEYTFNEPGDFVISYYGENADMESCSRTWNVFVKDKPLNVTFSVPGDVINATIFKEVSVTATATTGLTGFIQSWKLDGDEVSTESTVNLDIKQAGTYTLTYHGQNAASETADKSWTVNVVDYLIFDNFEASALGVSAYYIGNNPNGVNAIEVIDNPHVTAANPSAKVLCDAASKVTWNSSGYFKFKINTFSDKSELPASVRGQFKKMRVKIYLGDTGFCPFLQEDAKSTKSLPVEINGQPFDRANPTMDAWNALVKTNEWNVFVYDLSGGGFSTEIPNFGAVDQVQFRVTVDIKAASQAGKDVYFDDIEFIK